MKSLKLLHLYRNISVVSLSREIHSGSLLLARSSRHTSYQRYDPGLRNRKKALEDDPEVANELDLDDSVDDEVDVMNIDKAYDMHENWKEQEKKTTQYKIIRKKFFSPRAQPLMLTCNERHCIKYLHKQDPIQWDFRTLSESFPATIDTIKKIVQAKWKITPERAKRLDAKAQANWELLAQGKLDADEHVLEHMKKFVNRREILLEQIQNEKFYLPEVKKTPVWNNGEFSNIIAGYEKAIKKLVEEGRGDSNQRMLEDGTSKTKPEEEKSSLKHAHEKIKEAVTKKRLEEKDSFIYGGLRNSYSKPTTLENLEYDVLKKAEKGEELSVFDKAILEKKLGYQPQNTDFNYSSERLREARSETRNQLGNKPRNVDVDHKYNLERATEPHSERENKLGYNSQSNNYNSRTQTTPESKFKKIEDSLENTVSSKSFISKKSKNWEKKRMMEEELDDYYRFPKDRYPAPHDKTTVVDETKIGELLNNLKNGPQENFKPKEEEKEEEIEDDFLGKLKIDFSDPIRIKRENIFYDKEVKDIEHTSFWNSGHNSQKKAMLEEQKKPHSGPPDVEYDQVQTSLLSSDHYPERIKIPKRKWKKGLTYKVKDCYYDDDGKFLYRVPGMVK